MGINVMGITGMSFSRLYNIHVNLLDFLYSTQSQKYTYKLKYILKYIHILKSFNKLKLVFQQDNDPKHT